VRLGWWLLLATGCDSEEPEEGCLVTWDNYAHGFFVGYCETCHAEGSPTRHGAPDAISFATEAEARRWDGALRSAVLDEPARMPPGGGLTPEELALFEAWLDCDPRSQ
jgi:hypothetical protein